MTTRATVAKNIAGLIGQKNPSRLSGVIAQFLLDQNRTSELPSLMRDVADQRLEQKGIIEVTVVSVNSLSDRQIKLVKARVKSIYPKAKKIIVNFKIEDEAIGGIRLELPGQQLDYTIESKITRLRGLVK